MTDMNLGLVDLLAALLIVGAVVGSIRRGGRLLSAVGSGLATAVVVWLAAVAVATWAPPPAATYAADSFLVHAVPIPQHAIDQAEQLFGLHSTESAPR